jgi:glucosyl-dolichyl phosphate glucuronosyltransferase
MLSAIVPTRDRPERLIAGLQSLSRVQAPARGWEVIVVDDGSEPELERLVPAGLDLPPVRFVRQPPGGLNKARNRGVAEAQGSLIAFLDDDTIVDRGWARALVDAFADPACDAVGGRVTLRFEGVAPSWLTARHRSYLAEYDLGEEARWIDGEPVPVGANCAVRRSAFEAGGGFLSGLDRIGSSLVSNGDTEFFRRLQREGGRIRYEPGAHVEHCVPPDRLTLEFFQRRAHAQGRSDALLALATTGVAGSRARELLRAGRSLPISARSVLEGRGLTGPRIWLQYCRGRMSVVLGEPSTQRTLQR